MKWNKSARALAVVGLTFVSVSAWSQVVIQNNGTGTPVNAIPGGALTATVPSVINGGAGIAKGTLGTGGLSAGGGNGGPSGVWTDATPVAAGATATAAQTRYANGFGTGLVNSSHDFVTGGGSSGVAAAAGLCSFCHTPHKAKSTLLLWNHTLSSATFQWDVAATTSGTALPGFAGNAYNGPSAKCLSCHDGSVAIGDVGWFAESSSYSGGTGLSTFKVGGGSAQTGKVGSGNTSKQVGASGNLSGNHPVAVPYPFGGVANVYNGSTTGAQLASTDFVTDPTQNNIRLYSDVGGGAIVGKTLSGQTGIECSSCHDPHNKASKDDFFLRGNLAGSAQSDGYLCLQCHVK